MSLRALAIAGAAGIATHAGAFYAGRHTAPVKTHETVRTEFRDRVVTVQATAQEHHAEEAHAVDTSTRERIVYREGPIQYVERWHERTDTTGKREETASATVAVSDHETARVEVRDRVVERPAAPLPRWSIGAAGVWPVALRLPSVPSRVSLEGGVRVVGPLWATVGVSGLGWMSAGVRVTW